MPSPTCLSLERLRQIGYVAGVVERFTPHPNRRNFSRRSPCRERPPPNRKARPRLCPERNIPCAEVCLPPAPRTPKAVCGMALPLFRADSESGTQPDGRARARQSRAQSSKLHP